MLTGLIAVAYAGIVVFGTAHHEPWRDEVVSLSIAREMPSVLDLWRTLRHEGHPVLWYLLLRYAYFVFGSTRVLPMLSIVIAIAAILVFLTKAPLPLWIKCLFVFGYFPVFEYSVVARGNGLAMLLLFCFCALYPRRKQHPIALALALVGLANTTALGFVIAAAAGIMIVIDMATSTEREGPPRHRHVALVVYVAGLAHSIVSNLPDPSVLPLNLYHHDAGSIISSLAGAILSPAEHSASLLWIPLLALWLWLFFILLLRRPGLLAFLFVSLIGFELTFTLVYPASPRHMGYVPLVVIATLWLWNPVGRLDGQPDDGLVHRAEWWLRHLLLIPFTVALCHQVILGVSTLVDDARLDYSSSRRLAAIIGSDPRLERAIVIGEPETLTGSLPYYRGNRIFLPQENAFRDWLHIQIPGGRRGDYNLRELLTTATELRSRYDVPVVMALGWWLDGENLQREYVGSFFEQTFTMSPADRTEFLARTELLGRLRAAVFTDENYDVFVLR